MIKIVDVIFPRPGGWEHGEGLPGGNEPLPAHVQDDLLDWLPDTLSLEAGHDDTGVKTMGRPLYLTYGVWGLCHYELIVYKF